MPLSWLPEHGGEVLIQGASRGIGLALVEQCLATERVDRVWATCREPETAAHLQELAAAQPQRLRLVPLDVTDEPSIRDAAGMVAAQTDRLHLVLNAAGLLHDAERGIRPEKRLEQLDPAAMEALFRVNATGPLLVARHFLRLLSHGDPAVVAAISARVGSIADNRKGGWYGYRMSKAALNQGIRTLAIELGRRAPAVTCAALHPGTTDTDLTAPFQSWVPAEQLFPPERTARQLLGVIDSLRTEDSGGLFSWDGELIAY